MLMDGGGLDPVTWARNGTKSKGFDGLNAQASYDSHPWLATGLFIYSHWTWSRGCCGQFPQ